MILEDCTTLERGSIEARRRSRKALTESSLSLSSSSCSCVSLEDEEERDDAQVWDRHYDSITETDPHSDGYHDFAQYERRRLVRFHPQLVVMPMSTTMSTTMTTTMTMPTTTMPTTTTTMTLEKEEDDEWGQPADIWYSPAEFAKTTKDLQALVTQARQRQPQEQPPQEQPQVENDEELRGLEDLTSPHAYRQRKWRLTAVIQGVLQEQRRQSLSKEAHDPVKLSEASSRTSQPAQVLAWRRASGDASSAASALAVAVAA